LSVYRHFTAVLALPAIVTLAVPGIILVFEYRLGWRAAMPAVPGWIPAVLGIVLVMAGLALWAWTAFLFVRIGRGTLAPWDPPTRLVTVGPYAHVRNPMLSGVFAVLTGEAVLVGSWALLAWAAIFVVANLSWIRLWEEPRLRRRFGSAYREYQGRVPRWIPRLAPRRPPGP
jgi:protein-S-isoprenylcysteine O-methyltransferase Ste14